MNSVPGRLAKWNLPHLGVGTGTWKWGEDEVDPETTQAVVAYALQSGCPFFDTAPLYGTGFSERRLGEALRGVARDQFFISTKTGYAIRDGDLVETNLTRDELLRSVEGSLKRLGVDYLDVLHLHDPDCCLEPALQTAFPALIELREQGLVRAVGAGMNQWEMLDAFARHVDVDCFLLAGRYTLLEQESLAFLDRCQQKGLAVFLGGVYNTGILATGARPGARYNYQPAPGDILERVSRFEALCARYALPLRAAALQFPLAHPAVRALIVGLHSKEELIDAQQGLAVAIPADFWADLKRERLIAEEAPIPVSKGTQDEPER